MARILIATTPAAGHVNPMTALVPELVNRGHTVRWYTGKVFQPKVEQLGAIYQPIKAAYDFGGMNREEAFPTIEGLEGSQVVIACLRHFFIEQAQPQMEDILEILTDFPADVILADDLCFGAGFVREKTEIPLVNISNSIHIYSSKDTGPVYSTLPPDSSPLGRIRNGILHFIANRIILRELQPEIDDIRTSLGLPILNKGIPERINQRPDLYLLGTIPKFEYPRRDLYEHAHFVGAFLSPPPQEFEPPSWWDDLYSDRPIILVTQGTVANNDINELIATAIQALASEDVLVIATTGGTPVEALKLNTLPDNVRVEQFIPYHLLLPQVDVMITNGGYGGVQMALSYGVPLIVAAATEEKPAIASRVAWAGVGINLKTGTPSAQKIRDGVKAILNNQDYRRNAQQLQAEYQRYNAPQRAVDLMEQLLLTQGIAPIFRADTGEKPKVGVTPISDRV